MEEYIRDLYHDELRDGFLVTFDRKKVWNVELNLVVEFDRICKKYGLTYFMNYGTLLGAVRHQGFIPWDDDIDLMMPRPDYDRLKQVIVGELPPYYFFQDLYTDKRFVLGMSKLRDSRTSAIQYPEVKDIHQGIFIDIDALDAASDGSPGEEEILAMQGEIWATVYNPDGIIEGIRQGAKSYLPTKDLLALVAMPREERLRQFEVIAAERYGTSRMVNNLVSAICGNSASWERQWFDEVIDLPFETLRLPAPAAYDEILSCHYGDYHAFPDPLPPLTHDFLFSADIPYTECLEKIDFS